MNLLAWWFLPRAMNGGCSPQIHIARVIDVQEEDDGEVTEIARVLEPLARGEMGQGPEKAQETGISVSAGVLELLGIPEMLLLLHVPHLAVGGRLTLTVRELMLRHCLIQLAEMWWLVQHLPRETKWLDFLNGCSCTNMRILTKALLVSSVIVLLDLRMFAKVHTSRWPRPSL